MAVAHRRGRGTSLAAAAVPRIPAAVSSPAHGRPGWPAHSSALRRRLDRVHEPLEVEVGWKAAGDAGGRRRSPRRMVPSSSDHRPRIRRRCRSRRGCRRRRRRPGAGAAGRGYARRLVIRTGGSGRCLGVAHRVDRLGPAARPRGACGSRGCGDRRSRSRRPGRGPWWDVSGGMDADGQRWSESGLDARRG